jgi:hypothetical protein
MKKSIAVLAIILVTAFSAFSEEIAVVKSSAQTSSDIPLSFTFEKAKWENNKLYIWGTVKNTSNRTYKFVKVVFTVKDKDNKFISRRSWYVDPTTIEPGKVGYIENHHVECEGKRPAKIEYSVLGE